MSQNACLEIPRSPGWISELLTEGIAWQRDEPHSGGANAAKRRVVHVPGVLAPPR